jgi:outer membrane protein W
MAMRTNNKILMTSCLALLLTAAQIGAYARTKTKPVKAKHPITIGFQTGATVPITTSPIGFRRQKREYTSNKSFYLRKPLTEHVRFQTGICYSAAHNVARTNDGRTTFEPCRVALPLTLQYNFLPHSRIRPYCGAGVQCNFNINNGAFNPEMPAPSYRHQSGTQYVSILFTQGITFEINTKIQITQSFHFMPDNADKTIGIDLGIEYTLP